MQGQGCNRPLTTCPPSPPNVMMPGAAVWTAAPQVSVAAAQAQAQGQLGRTSTTGSGVAVAEERGRLLEDMKRSVLARARDPDRSQATLSSSSVSASRYETEDVVMDGMSMDIDLDMEDTPLSLSRGGSAGGSSRRRHDSFLARSAATSATSASAAAVATTTPASSSTSASASASIPVPTSILASSPHSHQAVPVNIPSHALSPPTPAPSPSPTQRRNYTPLNIDEDDPIESLDDDLLATAIVPRRPAAATDVLAQFRGLPHSERTAFLENLVAELQLGEVATMSHKLSPRLKRDFISDLPVEVALHCLSFLDDARTIGRAMRVCKYWYALLRDERLWKDLHHRGLYRPTLPLTGNVPVSHVRHRRHNNKPATYRPTYRERFRDSYLTESNWINGGSVLTEEDLGDPVVTSLVVGDKYTVVGMANSKICVYSSTTGRFIRDFEGHDLGVWALVLVTPKKAGSRRAVGGDDPSPTGARSSDICGTAQGWDKRTLLVSGGCDRNVYVWDMAADPTDPNRRHPWEFALRGHSSTVRCIKVLDGRPIAVSGSRDYTLRVWDIEKGRMLRVLDGHEQSVRCIEVVGNQVVSGSYDYTCRLWDIDTGECLQVFEGHYHQIYAVAFDGHRVISGSLDSTVRVWDAMTGECTAILQGHTSLVGQLQLDGDRLVTGGSDGRVIVFDLNDFSCVHRLCAHDNSVTCLQFDDRYIVSGGNDGCVKLWDVETGHTVRQLTRPCDAVWRVAFRNDKCVILCQRKGRTMLEVIGFRPEHGA